MATISSLGIGSGLDLNSLLTKLTGVEKQRLMPYTTQQSSYKSKLTAYGTLKGALEKFDDVSKELAKSDAFTITKASSHDQFTVTTSASAVPGNYAINVTQLAQAQSLTAQTHASSQTEQMGSAGASNRELTITVGEPPKETKIALSDEQTSLTGLRDAINKSGAGVKASVIQISDKAYTLSITAAETGAKSNIKLNVSGDSKLGDMLNYDSSHPATGTTNMAQTVEGKDAEMTLNGVKITRSSNKITDAPQGVTLELKAVTPKDSPQNLVITNDCDGVSKKIHDWVDSYNSLIDTFASLTKFTPVKKGQAENFTNGPLLGDNTLRAIQSGVKGVMSSAQDNPNIKGLGNLGISTDPQTGKLSIDDSKLKKVIDEYPEQLQHFFVGDGKDSGMANMIHKEIQSYIKSDGVIDSTTKSINNSLQHLSDRIDSVNQSIDETINRYKAQFVQLDKMMAKLNSTSSYLTQQFNAMSNSK
ncbi:flagellar filament capping protein FliD [Edwardsiella hoshinae]|uniref:Flagellar hook-associated protein 2 n=1 Tax=Edwardsiella hoshinae TaxID=93378 RepID=A0ABN4SW23_9GAMM|nr:flagellar filament capping protein FliD [Edwardsiella hoshinae]AOV96615.1 flagellar filament capping protein FliD [Edwardsiella hoshinae]